MQRGNLTFLTNSAPRRRIIILFSVVLLGIFLASVFTIYFGWIEIAGQDSILKNDGLGAGIASLGVYILLTLCTAIVCGTAPLIKKRVTQVSAAPLITPLCFVFAACASVSAASRMDIRVVAVSDSVVLLGLCAMSPERRSAVLLVYGSIETVASVFFHDSLTVGNAMLMVFAGLIAFLMTSVVVENCSDVYPFRTVVRLDVGLTMLLSLLDLSALMKGVVDSGIWPPLFCRCCGSICAASYFAVLYVFYRRMQGTSVSTAVSLFFTCCSNLRLVGASLRLLLLAKYSVTPDAFFFLNITSLLWGSYLW